MKNHFITWCLAQVQSQIDSGVAIDDIYIDLDLNPATCLVSLYNHLTSCEAKRYIAKGWEKAGIADVVSRKMKLPRERSS